MIELLRTYGFSEEFIDLYLRRCSMGMFNVKVGATPTENLIHNTLFLIIPDEIYPSNVLIERFIRVAETPFVPHLSIEDAGFSSKVQLINAIEEINLLIELAG